MMVGFFLSTFSELQAPGTVLTTQIPAFLSVTVGLWVFIWCLLTKSWLTFFAIKWTENTLQSEWQQLIYAKDATQRKPLPI